MRGSKWKVLTLGLAAGLAALPLPIYGEADEPVWVDTVECQSLPAAERYVFPTFREVEGTRYQLIRTEIETSEGTPVKETEKRMEIRTSDLLLPGEEWAPEETIWKDGISYHLTETRTENSRISGRTQKAEGWITYSERTTKPEIPESAEFEIEDADTGERRTVTLPLVRTEEQWRWQDDFQTILTAEPVDALEYRLGDEVVTLGGEEPGLSGHETGVLHVLGLDPDLYRIEAMNWAGPAYLRGGIPVRDINLSGSRYVASYRVYYAGEVPLDDVWGNVVVALYEAEVEREAGSLFSYIVRASYQPEQAHSMLLPATAGASAGMILTAILFRRRKKKSEEK